jgi:t-SNARE complex subunit (syntaxin)
MSKAVEHGKSARKMQWYIFAIVAVILIIVGIFVYLQVIVPAQKATQK